MNAFLTNRGESAISGTVRNSNRKRSREAEFAFECGATLTTRGFILLDLTARFYLCDFSRDVFPVFPKKSATFWDHALSFIAAWYEQNEDISAKQ